MIKVLQSWQEITEANEFLSKNALPKHGHNVEKDWDLFQLYCMVKSIHREASIIDLGCGDLFALKLLYALGFRNLYGIDLNMPLRNRLSQVYMMWKKRSFRVPFHLYGGDLTKTRFPDQMFDLVVCISVIEHEIDVEKFFAESSRLVKAGGILFITTDYWQEKINIQQDNRPFNLAWKIFSKRDIEDVINMAYKFNFSFYDHPDIPACSDKCVKWNNQEYTFLALIFKKVQE